jgi:class 3 adenylate cyclase
VLFCDLADSTALATRIGPEHMHTLLNRFFELARREVHRYAGTINQLLGDGFMALFGAPLAYEDHARRAALAAVRVQRVLHEHHAELGKPHGVACQFRMGLNTGLVVVGGIVGEAGQGKSRLLYEFWQRLAGKRITYLEGRCLSYGSTMPYRPIIDVVRHNSVFEVSHWLDQ